jgi:ribosome-associated protein
MKLAGFEIPDNAIEFSAIRASGPGGQHVNKVSSAVHLRFDIPSSGLPDNCKQRLLESRDRRISGEGVIIIKAQQYRSQEKNKQEALLRLEELILRSIRTMKPRKSTRPPTSSRKKRVDDKKARGHIKNLRGSRNIRDE